MDESLDQTEPAEVSANVLSLSEDFYCMTYCSFLKINNFSENKTSSYFMQCLFIFAIQSLLSFFIFYELGGKSEDDPGPLILKAKNTNMLTVRFMCSILLHLQLEGETRRALAMIKYFNNH